MPTCPACGSAVPEGSRFCGKCGHEIAPIIESENKDLADKVSRILKENTTEEAPQAVPVEVNEENARILNISEGGSKEKVQDPSGVRNSEKSNIKTVLFAVLGFIILAALIAVIASTRIPWLGVEISNVTQDVATAYGYNGTSGVVVRSVISGGPADKAGLQDGDIITGWNGASVADTNDLLQKVQQAGVGAKINLTIWHNTKPIKVIVTLASRPPIQQLMATMRIIFLILLLVALIALIVGLIIPKAVVRWGVKEKRTRGRAATIYGLAAVCFFILLVAVGVVNSSLYSTSKTSAATTSNSTPTTTNTTNPPTPSAVPGLNINNVSTALSSAGLNYNQFAENSSGVSYDDKNVGVVIDIGMFDNQNVLITDPSEDAARMMVMIEPDNSQFTTNPDGLPQPIPLTQNQIESVRDILTSIAEVDYNGASPDLASSWVYQNFNASSKNSPTTQIGRANYSCSAANMGSGAIIYFLDISSLSQSSQNNSNSNH
jgi:hypothetical protein